MSATPRATSCICARVRPNPSLEQDLHREAAWRHPPSAQTSGITGDIVPSWPLISTPRLHLRPATMDDLPAMEVALADSRFPSDLPLARMLRESKLSPWLQRMTSDSSNPKVWATTFTDNDTCIGTVALVEEKTPRTWWLSYWMSPTEWRKGLAREAVGALLAGAARHPSYEQVVAAVARSNLPSIRLLEQLEFTRISGVATAQTNPEEHVTMHRWLRERGRDD